MALSQRGEYTKNLVTEMKAFTDRYKANPYSDDNPQVLTNPYSDSRY